MILPTPITFDGAVWHVSTQNFGFPVDIGT
jgi:hypothetical protein